MKNRLATVSAFVVLLCVCLVWVRPASADPPPPPGDAAGQALKAKVIEAYNNTSSYQASYVLSMEQTGGGWRMSREGDGAGAFDRAGGRVMFEQPDVVLVSDGRKLRFRMTQVSGWHVETDAPKPLTYAAVVDQIPSLDSLVPPDLVLLLGDDVDGGLIAAPARAAGPDPDDPERRPRLVLETPEGTMTLQLDPQTHLIRRARLEMDSGAIGGPPGETVVFQYEIKVDKHDSELDEDMFSFDTSNSVAAASFEAMVQQAFGPVGGGGGGGGGGAGSMAQQLEGQPAPPVALNTVDGEPFSLEDAQAQVIVLDFWATWCPPCRRGLPELQKVHDWAGENDKPVAVYTVNLEETPEQVEQFWTDAKLTMPVLMDTDASVAQAYGVQGIPQTVIIKDGTVRHVHVGLLPNLEQTLRDQIEQLLEDDEPQQ